MKECDAREKSLSGDCILYCKGCECEWCKYAIPLLWRGAPIKQIPELEILKEENAKMNETIKLLNGSNEKLAEHNINLAEENERLKAENAELKASNSTILDRYFHRNRQYVELHKENQRLLELKNKFKEENEQLKAQLQSKAERKPHKCHLCDNDNIFFMICRNCGVSTVWENQ